MKLHFRNRRSNQKLCNLHFFKTIKRSMILIQDSYYNSDSESFEITQSKQNYCKTDNLRQLCILNVVAPSLHIGVFLFLLILLVFQYKRSLFFHLTKLLFRENQLLGSNGRYKANYRIYTFVIEMKSTSLLSNKSKFEFRHLRKKMKYKI